MAKCRASRIVGNAEVRLSTETIMVGGSAQRCVAESPSNPAGPLSERAVTIVLPVARWPMACQNCFMSIVAGLSDIISTAGCLRVVAPRFSHIVETRALRGKTKLHAYAIQILPKF